MNPKEALISISEREGVGKPSKSEVARFINIVFPKPRQAQLAYHRNEEFILAALKPLKDAYDERGESASRVKLSATMVLQGNGTELRNFADKAERDSSLLKQDPSGFMLIDDYLTDLRKETFSLLSEEYVMTGANLAADLYKSVYQISTNLTSV